MNQSLLPPLSDPTKVYGLFAYGQPVMNYSTGKPFTGTRGQMECQRVNEECHSVGGRFSVREIAQ